MKRYTIALFFFGLLTQLAALFGEHATEIPFVLKSVAPAYHHAQHGLEILRENNQLRRSDDGFAQVSEVLIKWLEGLNPKVSLKNAAIDNLRVEGSWLEAGGASVHVHYTVAAPTLGAPQEMSITLEQLSNLVDDLKRLNILFFCFGLFGLGTIIEIMAFCIERSEPSDAIEHQQNVEACKTAKPTERTDEEIPPP
jgi:hypothetical protein